MAEKRIITSDIWQDDWFGTLPMFEKLLWIGLFSRVADDQGRMIDNAVVIRAMVFPYDDIPVNQIERALQTYEQCDKVIRYEIEGKKYLQIKNWWDHQQGQWATPSKHPAPEGWTDRVRSYIKGVYREENWDKKGNKTTPQVDTPAGQSTWTPHVAGHNPDPDPEINPEINPEVMLIPATPEIPPEPKFIRQFCDILGVQFKNNEQANDLHELYETYGADHLLEVAAWASDKQPNNMGHALAMVRKAASTWKIKQPKEKSFAERLAEA